MSDAAQPAQKEEPPPYEEIKTEHSFADLVLAPKIKEELDSLLEDHEYEWELHAQDIKCRRTLILHGPPGCGKTSVAHAIAKHLKLKLYYLNIAQCLNAYQGESEKNITAALHFAHMERCIMLLDEFDSLASKRIHADVAGATTNNRIVNTILVGLDQKPPRGIIVACTNFYDSIDAAVKRRFKMKLEIPPASRDTLKKIAANGLKSSLDPAIDEVLAACNTPAEVADMCMDIRRRRVIDAAKKKKIELPGVDSSERIRQLANGPRGRD